LLLPDEILQICTFISLFSHTHTLAIEYEITLSLSAYIGMFSGGSTYKLIFDDLINTPLVNYENRLNCLELDSLLLLLLCE
jgi:hypothetical protein